ncbi:hypothetical protein H9Y05_04310 [Crocinitomicaceae bacterium CZZ-1]|uniref:Uncharacterized protein n=1 Tax=Taishania pollutisoli TaxID=2766479 RepID=A0A8J6TZ51_9FLAO|nr:hypothetical protein [Taishania pollutisoli]MBC9811693.1 hypothetical protein [Taishania pollutisoli]MBX2948373.1 hypothetical protein [Crocinitomicaceae bacterium]NGF75471.1 hypothetical protein [Fluviicola sp. SGL-29]
MNHAEELKHAAEKLALDYELLTGETAAAIINTSFEKFEPFRRQGHLGIMHERSVKLKLSEHEYTFSEQLNDEPLLVFFEQTRENVAVVFKLFKGRYFCQLLEECYGMEYFLTNTHMDYLIAVNWYTIEIVDNDNFL